MIKGVILIIVGVVALIYVHSLRPPSGFFDVLMRIGQEREFYLNEPVYHGFMAISGFVSVLGLVLFVKAIIKGKE